MNALLTIVLPLAVVTSGSQDVWQIAERQRFAAALTAARVQLTQDTTASRVRSTGDVPARSQRVR